MSYSTVGTPSEQAQKTRRSPRQWLNRLKVGEKIALGYILSLGVAIAGTATGIVVGNRYQNAASDKQIRAETEVMLLSQLQAGVLQSRTHQQQLIPLSEFPADFQDEYSHILIHASTIEGLWAEIEQNIAQAENRTDVDGLSLFVDTYDGVAARYLQTLDRLVADIDITRLNTPAEIQQAQQQLLAFTNSDLAIAFDGISDDLSQLIEDARVGYESAHTEAAVAQALRSWLILFSMVFSLLIAALLAILISHGINRPLRALEETATKVIQTEDFTLSAQVTTDDEIGSLTIALNQLIDWVGNRTQAIEDARDTLDKRVKERTQELNAIIDNLGNGLLVIDKEGKISRANPILRHIFNFEESDLTGKLAATVFEDSLIQLVEQSKGDIDRSWSTELTLPNERIGQATVTPILAEAETGFATRKPVGTVVLIRDVTTEKAVDRMKTDFISTVSHELRTPLTSVLGFAKIIQKKLETVLLPAMTSEDKKINRAARQIKDNLKIIISEGERLTSLINDVLDIAKIEAGKIEWRMADVDLHAVIDQAIAATSVLAQKNNVAVTTNIAPDLPTITADQDRLIQVFINLISNAIKFTPDGSVNCETNLTEEGLCVRIIDTGIGISAEDQPLVFEKFKQVGEIMTDKPQGTGLGLPICKQIVEHHNGRIWVESQLNVGSIFSVAFPLSAPINSSSPVIQHHPTVEKLVERIKADVKQTAPGESGTIKTILVVDDESNIRCLLRQELETEGYLVKEAKDGIAALEMIKQHPPDLIITDVMMPRLDGFDLAAVLKNNPKTANIPTVILSITEDKDRGFGLGVDRYLTKPINITNLLSHVETLLQKKTSRSKVLVVNKDSSASKILTDILLTKGYMVSEASTGKEGLDKARTIKPDMMIMDAAASEDHNIIKTLRFEKGLENISVILVEGTSSASKSDSESGNLEPAEHKKTTMKQII
ncbi:MAG: response regulator [Phormidesmis sp.]